MRTEYIVSAKTADEAYKKAVELYSSLGEISLEEVVNPGKKGFLGIFGAIPAEIRISVDDGKEERKPKQKNNAPKAQKPNEGKPQAQEKTQAQQKPQQKKQANPSKKEEAKTQQTENKSEPKLIKDEDITVTAKEKTIAMEFLKNFVRDIGFDCQVKGDMTPNEKGDVSRLITIEGKDAPTLIGHRGEMLDSIQYLANLCLARKGDGERKEYVKVVIDIENYREKREQSLRALARRMAEKAIKYQRNVLLEPMNPYERMIIHSEIQSISGVSTHSVGYDENRKIVITVDGLKKKK